MRSATMLSSSVTRKRTSPSAKAASVLALSNSWSPVSSLTICAVTVVTLAKGLAVRLAESPAAITTIIVSPIARLTEQYAAHHAGQRGGDQHLTNRPVRRRPERERAVAHRLRPRGDVVVGQDRKGGG